MVLSEKTLYSLGRRCVYIFNRRKAEKEIPVKLVSSYRVVPFFREGQRDARLEVLLKQAAKVNYQKNPGALQMTFMPAAGSTQAAASSAHEAPSLAAHRAGTPATTSSERRV